MFNFGDQTAEKTHQRPQLIARPKTLYWHKMYISDKFFKKKIITPYFDLCQLKTGNA